MSGLGFRVSGFGFQGFVFQDLGFQDLGLPFDVDAMTDDFAVVGDEAWDGWRELVDQHVTPLP